MVRVLYVVRRLSCVGQGLYRAVSVSGYFSALVVGKSGDMFCIEWPTGERVCGQFEDIACSESLEVLFTAMKNECTHTCKRCWRVAEAGLCVLQTAARLLQWKSLPQRPSI